MAKTKKKVAKKVATKKAVKKVVSKKKMRAPLTRLEERLIDLSIQIEELRFQLVKLLCPNVQIDLSGLPAPVVPAMGEEVMPTDDHDFG